MLTCFCRLLQKTLQHQVAVVALAAVVAVVAVVVEATRQRLVEFLILIPRCIFIILVKFMYCVIDDIIIVDVVDVAVDKVDWQKR